MRPKCSPSALSNAQEVPRNNSSAPEGSDAPQEPPGGLSEPSRGALGGQVPFSSQLSTSLGSFLKVAATTSPGLWTSGPLIGLGGMREAFTIRRGDLGHLSANETWSIEG